MEDNFWNDETVKEFYRYLTGELSSDGHKDEVIRNFKKLVGKSKQQSVENKDYEIMALRSVKDGGIITKEEDCMLARAYKLRKDYWEIYELLRLSDNETFAINELTRAGNKIHSFEETKFGLLANMGSFKVPLEDLVKRKIDNKDWEILSVSQGNGSFIEIDRNGKVRYAHFSECTIEDALQNRGFKIYSVKRLSDNEVFTVGDWIQTNNVKIDSITGFKVLNGDDMYVNAKSFGFSRSINEIEHEKQKQPFTTEDNVPIYEGDEYAYVPKETLAWVNVSDGYSTPQPKESFLYFSSKAKANDYVLIKKPCLSVDDVMSKYEQIINRISKPFKEHLIDLANEKINHQKQYKWVAP